MIISFKEAVALRKQMENQRDPYPSGHNIVGDHEEDYVVDALFDIPNR